MKVSVIIPVYRHWEDARRCLSALERQTFPNDAFEVIMVNNEPAVPKPENFEFNLNLKVIDEPAKGSYAARNAGIRTAEAGILCFTDADCRPKPDWIEVAYRALTAPDAPARVGGPIQIDFPDDRLNWIETYEKLTAFNQQRNVQQFFWSATANMCTTSRAFERVGLFDSQRLSGGDQEWGKRAQAEGLDIRYLPELCVLHPPRATWQAIVVKNRRLAGAKATQKQKRQSSGHAASYLFTLPIKLLPSHSGFRRIWRIQGATVAERLKAYWVSYALRLVRKFEEGRILILGRTPENR